jgi:protein arginine kinase activator
MMLCQACNQNPATIHITEISPPEATQQASAPSATDISDAPPSTAPVSASAQFDVREQHLCEECAQSLELPSHLIKKSPHDLWKQLLVAAQMRRRDAGVACPDCGMTLLEFRQKGRMGCPKDYEVFGAHTRELLERIHGATRHVGRAPGQDQAAVERQRRMSELQRELESAIRQEAYEQAARLRDQLKSLQQG